MVNLASVLVVQSRLPAGWVAEDYGAGDVVIRSPHGSVTIDVERRIFKLGYGIGPPRPYSMACKYTGRGWLGRLVDDAIKALKEATNG